MKVFLDYDVLGIPEKDNDILSIYIKIKERIIEFSEQFNGKYDTVFPIVTINLKEGLCFYYYSENIELKKEWEKVFDTIDFGDIYKELNIAKSN